MNAAKPDPRTDANPGTEARTATAVAAPGGPLQRALAQQAQLSQWAASPLELLPDAGLAHLHVRLLGTGVLARIPKQSQLGLAPAAALAYEAACFERAAGSGHVPRLHAVLPPSADLPRGALLVEEIVGRPASLPGDLPALMQALAALHAFPLPAPHARAPLRNAADPLRDLQGEIAAQAQHLAAAGLAPATQQAIASEIARFGAVCAAPARPPRSLVSFDAHPGNFIVQTDGRAVLVDLEKCRYAAASLDLAHATLYTSTTWDVSGSYALSVAQIAQSWSLWHAAQGAAGDADGAWHLPLRRAMWLWSVTWCALWRAQSGAAPRDRPHTGADWSSDLSEPALVRHVRGRVDHYLEPDVVLRMLAEFDALSSLS